VNFKPLIQAASKAHGIPESLLHSIVLQESSGKPSAYRFEPAYYERYLKGRPEWADLDPDRISASYGLFQIMFPTARQHGFKGEPEELFIPTINVEIACKILKNLLEWSEGDIPKAVAAYNGGKGNWAGSAPQFYAKTVLDRQKRLEGK
jgi:soluble lytic murein transglycosylase-like protein